MVVCPCRKYVLPPSAALLFIPSFLNWWLQLYNSKLSCRWPSQCHARSHHLETALLRPPVRVRGTNYCHTSVWCSPLTLLDVILKHFYFTRPFYHDTVRRPCYAPAKLRRRNLDFLHTYIHAICNIMADLKTRRSLCVTTTNLRLLRQGIWA